ncbi:hypothetical protein SAMN05661012_03363 [Chitinophaga sancti]|uniref:Uncharacterized protein n=1 Tax=Chitinophaga sancti TaxID=1004 RepID=A0A1K1R3M0_9BACT|nr:hypothetical protein SAMN05661012_03363 [Chitinophaga sancti]
MDGFPKYDALIEFHSFHGQRRIPANRLHYQKSAIGKKVVVTCLKKDMTSVIKDPVDVVARLLIMVVVLIVFFAFTNCITLCLIFKNL